MENVAAIIIPMLGFILCMCVFISGIRRQSLSNFHANILLKSQFDNALRCMVTVLKDRDKVKCRECIMSTECYDRKMNAITQLVKYEYITKDHIDLNLRDIEIIYDEINKCKRIVNSCTNKKH